MYRLSNLASKLENLHGSTYCNIELLNLNKTIVDVVLLLKARHIYIVDKQRINQPHIKYNYHKYTFFYLHFFPKSPPHAKKPHKLIEGASDKRAFENFGDQIMDLNRI